MLDIKLIQETAVEADGKRLLEAALPTQLRIVRNDEKVVDLEQYALFRRRFRGTYATPLIDDFAHYVSSGENPPVGVPVFIDLEHLGATAIFNLRENGQPGHGDNRATLSLERSAPYRNLLKIADGKHAQRTVAEFIEEWAPYLQAFGEDYFSAIDPSTASTIAAMPLGKVVAAIRGITVKEKREAGYQERNFGQTRSVLEAIDAKGDGEHLPTVLVFECVPYEGFAPRRFELRLNVLTSDPPLVSLRLIGKERHDEELGQELRTKLVAQLGDKAIVRIGSFLL
jgi:uncharacterized protein YfdQ (DUF2303 family)